MTGESPGAALARYYDLDLTDDPGDLELYLALADARGGDVLELCAGSGRVSVPLAVAGYRVTAMDNDPAMLERAAKRWQVGASRVKRMRARKAASPQGELELVTADVTTYRSKRRYNLAIMALNSLLLLDGREAQQRALEAMAHHLTGDGRAVIDVWLPTPEDLEIYDGRAVLEWVRRDGSGEWVAKTTSARYEPATQVAEVTTFFDAWSEDKPLTRTMRRDRIAFIGAYELVALAEGAGLTVETMGGDHALSSFGGDSERVVLVCRVGAARSNRVGESAGP